MILSGRFHTPHPSNFSLLLFCFKQKFGHVYTLVFPRHYVSRVIGRTSTASGYEVPVSTFSDDTPCPPPLTSCPAPPTPCPVPGRTTTASGYEIPVNVLTAPKPCLRRSTTESGYQIPLNQCDQAGVVSLLETREEAHICDDHDVSEEDDDLYAEVNETAI